MAVENHQPTKKPGDGLKPVIFLIIAAIIIFGIMIVFMYLENQNPDWLRPSG